MTDRKFCKDCKHVRWRWGEPHCANPMYRKLTGELHRSEYQRERVYLPNEDRCGQLGHGYVAQRTLRSRRWVGNLLEAVRI